ncbi:hypothetical protein LTR28_001024, partial [Elasticomyces elasticus]
RAPAKDDLCPTICGCPYIFLICCRSTCPSSSSVAPSTEVSRSSRRKEKSHARLMLVSNMLVASFSTSLQTPSLSRIRAILGASWMPAPTNP